MNLMRQRDDLADACRAGCLSKAQLDMALDSPVFQWWMGDQRDVSDDDSEFIRENLMDVIEHPKGVTHWPKITPYECFRISHMDSPVYEQWFVGEDKLLCFRCDDGYSQKGVKMWTVHGNTRGSDLNKLWMWVNGRRLDLHSNVKRSGRVELIANDVDLARYVYQATVILGLFLFDIYASGSSVIKVSPDATGKSVQWRKAREHYLVLHHKQAKELQQGKRPHVDGDLMRSAHWRRAHLRRLSSNKFVNKKGLLIPVKKAWVGPEEWKGTDGKTYTVVGIPLDKS